LVRLRAFVEASIDFPEEDIEILQKEGIVNRLSPIQVALQELLATYSEGRLHREGVRTVLVGRPNAGKSSLLNELPAAKSRVANYAFTTLEPHLGEFYGRILADIPGLIEGASSGRGLGIKFLKHVERTGILLHLVSSDQDDPFAAYKEVHKEIETFGHELAKKREILILSKIDLITPVECETKMQLLARETEREVLSVSVKDSKSVKAFADQLAKILN